MADDFSKWQRVQDPQGTKAPFVSKARTVHRFRKNIRLNKAKEEAASDRKIFLIIMSIVLVVAVIIMIGVLHTGLGTDE